eukprot:TRINITY_DN8465_c0_g1_i27.p1 TRINITY_DN8465_c0_g1~~TRINITY_DN8465_c0_g1_i27.p1  ORF type:complete len:231 (+),score=53.92 TRINITY_DN8465_c0_g1_i27:1402-2094(+)
MGNAPPMRAIPLAFTNDKLLELSVINADASHPHFKARAASFLVATCARYIFEGNSHDNIIKHGLNQLMHVSSEMKHGLNQMSLDTDRMEREFTEYLNSIDGLSDYHRDGNSDGVDTISERDFVLLCGPQPLDFPSNRPVGLPCDSMRTVGVALYLLKFYKSPFDLLKHCIFIGGDIDSLASICLGIVGGRYGLYDLPQFLFDKLEGVPYLEDLSLKFSQFLRNSDPIQQF